MLKKNINLIVLVLLLVIIVSANPVYNYLKANFILVEDKEVQAQQSSTTLKDSGINEDRSIYSIDNPTVIDFYITVLAKSESSSQSKYMNFEDMNKKINATNPNIDPNLQVIIQEGNESGPEKGKFGYGVDVPNGIIELRGQSTRQAIQKSYKVKLFDSAGSWNGQKILNFNKHPFDLTRVRNKLSFDLFTMLPNMTSLRTQFVRLHIKDLSSPNATDKFVDYGLFTEIEQPNKSFLASHGLDPNGTLYKADNFDFSRMPDVIKNVDDPSYDKKKFDNVLEVRAGNDNSKLIEMLDELNDYTKDIDEVIDKYFDRDNYLTWLATNILMGNTDTRNRNFLLYSPMNSTKWYFMPWDYDGAWDWTEQVGNDGKMRSEWEKGASNYWEIELHRRFFKNPDNIKQLTQKVEEVSHILNKQNTKKLLDSYYSIIKPIISREPDLSHLEAPYKYFDSEYNKLPGIIESNKKNYLENLEKPLPVFLGKLAIENNQYVLTWDQSYDFQGDGIYYDFSVATDPEFKNVVVNKPGLDVTKTELPTLQKGDYYWKITVRDSKGNTQLAFDNYTDNFGKKYYGMCKITIN